MFFLKTATLISCVLMCDNVICSLLYTLLVFCIPPYPQFTAAKRSPCPAQVVYLPALDFLPIPPFIFVLMTLPSLTVRCLYPLDLIHGMTEFPVFRLSSSSCPCEAPVIGKSTIQGQNNVTYLIYCLLVVVGVHASCLKSFFDFSLLPYSFFSPPSCN